MIESVVEGPSEGHLVQLPCIEQGQGIDHIFGHISAGVKSKSSYSRSER